MSWWCAPGGFGVVGTAWVGTLCDSDGWNTNLNERQQSAAGSGYVSLISSGPENSNLTEWAHLKSLPFAC